MSVEGRSAFVFRKDEPWYSDIKFDLSDERGIDYDEMWMAITCG